MRKEQADLKKDQIRLPEIKNVVTEIKDSVDKLNIFINSR